MRQVPLIDFDPGAGPLVPWGILARGMFLSLDDELVPGLVGNPVIVFAKENIELWHVSVVCKGLVANLPKLLSPRLLGDDGHLVHAQVQRLVDAVAASQEPRRDLCGVRVHAQDSRRHEAQQRRGQQRQEPPRDDGHVPAHEGRAAHEVELHALGRPGQVRDGGEEQDPRAQVQARHGRGVVHVPVEELEGQVGAERVADEHDVVKGLARAGPPGGDGARGRGEVPRARAQLVLHVVRRVVARVEGPVVVRVVEALEVAAVDVEGYPVLPLGLDGVQVPAQEPQEGLVVADQARVTSEEVDEAFPGFDPVLGRVGGWE